MFAAPAPRLASPSLVSVRLRPRGAGGAKLKMRARNRRTPLGLPLHPTLKRCSSASSHAATARHVKGITSGCAALAFASPSRWSSAFLAADVAARHVGRVCRDRNLIAASRRARTLGGGVTLPPPPRRPIWRHAPSGARRSSTPRGCGRATPLPLPSPSCASAVCPASLPPRATPAPDCGATRPLPTALHLLLVQYDFCQLVEAYGPSCWLC